MDDRADSLPVYELQGALAEAMAPRAEGVRVVVEAPTGSGKSTQIPRMIVNDRLVAAGQVVVLQPRRLAARLLARRVASEQGVRLGEGVGYQVRFEKAAGPDTRIRYVTEGILLREMMADPRLPGIAAVVFDEFHERHLYGDITLARALEMQSSLRPDLAIIVMSATLESARLDSFLTPCSHLRSTGRLHPVEIRYVGPRSLTEEPWEQAARVAPEAARATDGHVLVFMPGAYEIRRTLEALRADKSLREFDLVPLHGELPPADQDRAVDPGASRRIIVSTNVAETSLTIEGVTAVIDSGLARMARFDSRRGINTLTVEKISQASAAQRAGRAGRTGPGICWRLWSEREHSRRAPQEIPEVQRVDLAEVVLTLLVSGVEDLDHFRWFEAPEARPLALALDLLRELGAIVPSDLGFRPTPLGRQLTAYPLHPRHARILEAAGERDCLNTFARVLALAQGRPIFGRAGAAAPESFVDGHEFSDFQPQLRALEFAEACRFDRDTCAGRGVNALASREAAQLAVQLVRYAARGRSRPPSGTAGHETAAELEHAVFGQIFLSGFPDHVARRTNEGSLACDMVGGRRAHVPRESLIRRSPLVVAAEVREIEGRELQVVLGGLTAIDESWLEELFPDDWRRTTEVLWDDIRRRAVQVERTVFRDLVLSERQSGEPDPARASALLAERVSRGELRLTAWDDAVEQWIARLNSLAHWMPELELPALTAGDRAFIVEQLCHGAASYKEIKDRSPWPVLRSWLSPAQSESLDSYAPERVPLPDGRSARVIYSPDGSDPGISARIQQLYGLVDSPRLAGGRVTPVVTILGPNMRPLQVTRDLRGFWENHYPRLKSELQRKYPKHEWR